MSKVIQYKGGHNTGSPYDIPGYEYDAVNDNFKDLATGVVFDSKGSGAAIEANKAFTVDVSGYTGSVTIVPTSPNTSMKKVTLTLSDIPDTKLYAYKDGSDNYVYMNSDHTKVITVAADGSMTVGAFTGDISDYTRDTTKDLTLWQ